MKTDFKASIISEDQWKQAITAHQVGDLEKAAVYYQQLLDAQPMHTAALHQLGIIDAQQGRFEAAVQRFRQALDLMIGAPELPRLHQHLGNALVGLKQFEEATYHFKIALALAPDDAKVHNNVARLYYKQQDFTCAHQHFTEAIRLQPYYLEAQLNLGLVLIAQAQPLAAMQQFQEVLQQQPEAILAHEQLAQLAVQQGDSALARQHYHFILQRQPENVDACNNVGAILSQAGQYNEAAHYFEQALLQDPQHASARSNLAAVHLQQDQLKEAIWHYTLYLRLVPEESEAHYNIGVAFMLSGRLPEAIAAFQQATILNPQAVDAWCNLAAIYLRQSDKMLAEAAYQQVLNVQADHPIACYMLQALTQSSIPSAAPPEYVRNLFDHYAPQFDQHLTQVLQYQAPQLLGALFPTELRHRHFSTLDLGCGTGLSGLAFQEIAQPLTGIDISPRMLAEAKKKGIYTELIAGDFNTILAQWHRQYELILCVDTLVYFGDLQPIFQRIAPCLQPAAYFAFSVELGTIAPYSLQTTGRYQHTRETILTLAQQYGFTLIAENDTEGRQQDAVAVKLGFFLLQMPSS